MGQLAASCSSEGPTGQLAAASCLSGNGQGLGRVGPGGQAGKADHSEPGGGQGGFGLTSQLLLRRTAFERRLQLSGLGSPQWSMVRMTGA